MHSTFATAFLSLLSLSYATYGHHQSQNYDITVGADAKLVFNPEKVTAKVGDTLTFTFFPKNHSVVQSDFANPCKPINLPNEEGAIFSGFMPVADGQQGAQKFIATVRDDSKPLWFYCAQTTGNHCQSGMAMVVNEPAEPNTLAKYKENAENSGVSEVPPTIGGGVFRPNDKATPPSGCPAPPAPSSTAPATHGGYPQGGNAYMRARSLQV